MLMKSPSALELRAVRKLVYGMSWSRFARAVGVTVACVAQWEAGRATPAPARWRAMLAGRTVVRTPTARDLSCVRSLLRLSQWQVSQLLGISEITVDFWETNRRVMPAVIWADFLHKVGLPPDWSEDKDMLTLTPEELGKLI